MKNADENELRSIASEPENTHVYNVADFNIMSSIVEGLTRTVCEQVEQQDKEIKQSKDTIRRGVRECKVVMRHIHILHANYFMYCNAKHCKSSQLCLLWLFLMYSRLYGSFAMNHRYMLYI